jgi:hypothetical protein
MLRYTFSSLIKYLIGLLLVEAATALLVAVALDSGRRELWALLLLLGVALALLGAFWFATITSHASRETIAHAQEDFSRERERIRVQAERDKARLLRESHRAIIRDRDRVQSKTSLRNGASLAAVLGIGGIMLFTQFMTFGLLLLTAAGSAAAGYGLRMRQEQLTRDRKPALGIVSSAARLSVAGTALGRGVAGLLKNRKSDASPGDKDRPPA